MLVTLLVSQLLKYPLKAVALLNVFSIVVTLLVSQLKVVDTPEDAPLLKTSAFQNILLIFVTLPVSQLLILALKASASENI